jgi:uncharacterized protein
MTIHQNHLADQPSLYLRQHADNPVDWYPWGEEAFAKARAENKPILLSIGYSACHWCHVMARESFVDIATAELMNALFINIKVDREERPDLDKIYQLSHQLLTGRGGGWPLTVFLTPDDHLPFFAGTYFPSVARYGMPSFKQVLQELAGIYRNNPSAVRQQNAQFAEMLKQLTKARIAANEVLDDKPISAARAELQDQFDSVNGGFGGAPKFPNPTNLEFLLKDNLLLSSLAVMPAKAGIQKSFLKELDSRVRGNDDLLSNYKNNNLKIVETTLTKMAFGGIYDHIGGGFFRYSVDAQWEIPHFEKMLYDNAQLLSCYAQAYLIEDKNLYKKIIIETVNWLQREMQSIEGGFYSTLDADSEHVEGKFYYWDKAEIQNLLTVEEYQAVSNYFNLNQAANFEEHWHLHVVQNNNDPLVQSAREKLLQVRNKRIRPGRDEKILTAWNALLIKGLVLAGFALDKTEWITAAQKIVDFIRANLWINKRLFACYQHNKAYLPAYLDDHAFLLEALLTLLQVRFRAQDLQWAIELAEILLTYFYDDKNGGFFFTATDHEQLIQRPKPLQDEAIPAGNSIAAYALLRLGRLLDEPRYLQAAEKTLRAAWLMITAYPSAHCSLLNALQEYLHPQYACTTPRCLPLVADAVALEKFLRKNNP